METSTNPPFATTGVLQGLELVDEHPERVRLQWKGETFPAWLNGGVMLRNGPSLYRVGEEQYQHLFDGLTTIRGFYFDDSGVSFASRYLQSPDYVHSTESGRICYTEFGTAPDRSLLQRLQVLFNMNRQFGDNCNVNIIPNGADWWAVYDWPVPMSVNPRTLATGRSIEFSDHQRYLISTPHQLFDPRTSEWFNFGVGVGLTEGVGYRVYKRKIGSLEREKIAFIERLDPAYMHSFAMTENFIILTEHPFRANMKVATDAFMDQPLVNGFDWRGDEKTNFIVIDRTLNRVVCEIETETVLVLHHANAFEDRGRIVIDICAYPDDKILKSLYLEELKNHVDAPAGWLYRYTLDPAAGTAICEKHPDIWFEMPRFNDAYAFKPYTALYGNSKKDFNGTDFFDSLVKIDPARGIRTGEWHEPGVFPGEPIFIARPDGTAEDDGVVICVVRTPAATDGHFYLLILDGHSFEEIGRAVAPPGVEIAPDFHGNFQFPAQPGHG